MIYKSLENNHVRFRKKKHIEESNRIIHTSGSSPLVPKTTSPKVNSSPSLLIPKSTCPQSTRPNGQLTPSNLSPTPTSPSPNQLIPKGQLVPTPYWKLDSDTDNVMIMLEILFLQILFFQVYTNQNRININEAKN